MSEITDMVETAASVARAGWPAALATVVRVGGSAYRRPGARLLVTDDGRRMGSISGGCLEGDVVRRAAGLSSGEAILVRYDTGSAADIVAEFGLGCRGLIEVLVERLPAVDVPHPLEFVQRCETEGINGVVARVIHCEGAAPLIGRWLACDEAGAIAHNIDCPELLQIMSDVAGSSLARGEHHWARHRFSSGSVEVFYEVLRPPLRLLVAGSGYDAVPLVRLAKEIGWHVTVAGRQAASMTRDRFPQADAILLASRAEMPDVAMSTRCDAAVLMTHSYLDDYELLRVLLASPARYVGLLGPRDRAARLLQDLADEGTPATPEQLRKLYAPVGLDIGAETPAQIALAVVAEVQSILAGGSGVSLRDRPGPIHAPRSGAPEILRGEEFSAEAGSAVGRVSR